MKLPAFLKNKKIWLVILFIFLLVVLYVRTRSNHNEGFFLTCIQAKTRVKNSVSGLCAAQTDSDKAKARDELDTELEKYRTCMDYTAGVAAYQASIGGSSSSETSTSQPNAACISAKSAFKNIVDSLCAAKTEPDKARIRDEIDTELEKYRTCGSSTASTPPSTAATTSQLNQGCISAKHAFNTARIAADVSNLNAHRDAVYNSCPYQEYTSLMNQYPSTTPYTVKSSPN